MTVDARDNRNAIMANRIAWDHAADLHRGNAEWLKQCDGFADPQYSVLDATLSERLTRLGIRGKDCVQLGCNNGREILSLKALGAGRCLGIDQSAAFLEQAAELTQISGHDAEFLCANVYELPQSITSKYDLVLITIGVLNWMPDLASFFSAAASLLRQGGKLIIYETHPFLEMFDPDAENPFLPSFSYFDQNPQIFVEDLVYDGNRTDQVAPESYWYTHGMGQILTACARAGFCLQELTEFPYSIREVDYDIYTNQNAQLPMSYLLEAALIQPGL